MMDERTLEAAAATTDRHLQEAIARGRVLKKYTILVMGGRFETEPLTIMAVGAEDRTAQMRDNDVDPNNDRWAAAQHNGSSFSICGNDAEAKEALDAHLRNTR